MIPTCYLRMLRKKDDAGVYVVLQQWWSNDGSGPDATQGEQIPDPANRTMTYRTVWRKGEWREVEIVQ